MYNIPQLARSEFMSQFVEPGQPMKRWVDWDEQELIQKILTTFCGSKSVETTSTLFARISMKAAEIKGAYDGPLISTYLAKVYDTIEMYPHVLAQTGFPEQIKLFIANIHPYHFRNMLRPLVSHFTDWASIFSACRCLMDVVITVV